MDLEAVRAGLGNALRLYVLTDRRLAGGRAEAEVVRAALAGGATAIQLRWKTGPLREALAAGREVRELCRAAGVLFVVNDRIGRFQGLQFRQGEAVLVAQQVAIGHRIVELHAAAEIFQCPHDVDGRVLRISGTFSLSVTFSSTSANSAILIDGARRLPALMALRWTRRRYRAFQM